MLLDWYACMAVSVNLGVHFLGVRLIRSLLFWGLGNLIFGNLCMGLSLLQTHYAKIRGPNFDPSSRALLARTLMRRTPKLQKQPHRVVDDFSCHARSADANKEALRPLQSQDVNPARYNRACYFGCFKEASKSVQVLLNSIEAVVVLTRITLK